MALLILSPALPGCTVSSQGLPVPNAAPVGNEYTNWLSAVLNDFATNHTALFQCVTFSKIDLDAVGTNTEYVMLFPALAVPADNSPIFKSLLCIGASNNVYRMKNDTPICLSTSVSQLNMATDPDVTGLRIVPQFVLGTENDVWSSDPQVGNFSEWLANNRPADDELPFKNASLSVALIQNVFNDTGCDTLALMPVSLKFNDNSNHRNSLILAGVDAQGEIKLAGSRNNEIWICGDVINKYGNTGLPPWRSGSLITDWS